MKTDREVSKLNLGCGGDYREGFINIDASPDVRADYCLVIGEDLLLDHFKPNTFSYILARDIIEHLYRYQAIEVLSECYILLEKGGKIKMRIPDFDAICNTSEFSSEKKIHWLFGSHAKGTRFLPFHSHRYAYTKETMERELRQIGFMEIQLLDGGSNFVAEAIK